MTVIVARIALGVTVLVEPAAARERACKSEPVIVFAVCSTFISSYCSVLRFALAELYRKVSNHEFQLSTATNRAIVARTGLHNGRITRRKMVNSPAPSILADSTRLSGKLVM